MNSNDSYSLNNCIYTSRISDRHIFIYIVIICLASVAFSKINIKLNTIIGIVCGCIIVLYINYCGTLDRAEKNNIAKNEQIIPELKNAKKYDDIVNFLFDIQHLSRFNMQAYSDMTKDIEAFFECYDNYNKKYDSNKIYIGHEQMDKLKRGAISNLHSMIISIPSTTYHTGMLNNGKSILNDILERYLNDIVATINVHHTRHGYSLDTKIINNYTKPFNTFDDMFFPYTFDVS